MLGQLWNGMQDEAAQQQLVNAAVGWAALIFVSVDTWQLKATCARIDFTLKAFASMDFYLRRIPVRIGMTFASLGYVSEFGAR